MAKTKEELEQLKKDCEKVAAQLNELSDEELDQVTGGSYIWDVAVKLKELCLNLKKGPNFNVNDQKDKDETLVGISKDEHNIML